MGKRKQILRLKDTRNYEILLKHAFKNETIKPILDTYIKSIFDNLKKLKINIPTETNDFEVIERIHVADGDFIPESRNTVHFYYNMIYSRIIEKIQLNLGDEIMVNHIGGKVKPEFKANPKRFINNIIDIYTREVLLPVRNLIFLMAGDIKGMQKEINNLNKKLTRKSMPGDISYELNMGFIKKILVDNSSKYRVVLDYLRNHKNIKTTEKSMANTLDKFLKNHRSEIIKKYHLSENDFDQKFFPKTLSTR